MGTPVSPRRLPSRYFLISEPFTTKTMYHITEEYLQIPCVGITEPSHNSVQLIVRLK